MITLPARSGRQESRHRLPAANRRLFVQGRWRWQGHPERVGDKLANGPDAVLRLAADPVVAVDEHGGGELFHVVRVSDLSLLLKEQTENAVLGRHRKVGIRRARADQGDGQAIAVDPLPSPISGRSS